MSMEDQVTVHGGILGTRKLAAAYATLILRRKGLLIPTGPRREWTSDEEARARELRAKGKTYDEIGAILKRPGKRPGASVHGKIGRRAA